VFSRSSYSFIMQLKSKHVGTGEGGGCGLLVLSKPAFLFPSYWEWSFACGYGNVYFSCIYTERAFSRNGTLRHPKHGAQPSLLDGLFPLESTSNKEGHACQAWPWPRNHGLGARVFPLLTSLAGARPSLSTCCEINPVEKWRGVSHHGLTHTSVPHQDSESSHL
jgi:hypothetical protein